MISLSFPIIALVFSLASDCSATANAAHSVLPETSGASPRPLVEIFRFDASTVKLFWAGDPSKVFALQYTDDLSTWTTAGVGKMSSWTDDLANATRRFYRLSSNSPPELGSIGDKAAKPGEKLQFTLTATDPDGDAFSFGASNMPEGAVLDPQSGVFTWTPAQAQEGSHVSVRFSVADDGVPKLSDYEEVTIVVGQVPPEIIVTYPRGGRHLEAGTIESMEWSSKGNVGDFVHIDLTPDGGITWYVIKENAPNVGYYNWIVPDHSTVPELPSDDCWIAVWSQDESTYGLTDDAFSIYETVLEIWAIYLVAGDGEYLGDCTTNPYVWDSIWNELGPYGSIASWTSIWNPGSVYGSDYSDLSPWDPYAFDPPYIFVNDEYVASLTTNYLIFDAVHPEDFFDWVESVGY